MKEPAGAEEEFMRSGLGLRAVLAVAATLLAVGTGRAADVTIRFSTAAPPSDFLAKSLEAFKTEVEAANVGVKVETHPASTLFRQGTEVPALQRGNLEMSTMTTFEVAQQMAEYGLFNRAYLFRDYDHLRAVFDGPIGTTYRRAVADKMGIEILAVAYLGTRQANLRQKRSVKAPADLAGIKMRMPAGPEWLLLGKAIGVSPVPLGMPEVYLALKTGSIDGQENPLSILNAAKFYEVTEQVVLTSHMVQPVFFDIAKPFWEKLTPDQKAALEKAARNAAKLNDSGRLADEKAIVEAIKGRGLAVDAVDLAPFRAMADKVYGESDATKVWNAGLAKQVADTR
jgi:tripartite ATP-independent transporter DctP family solute receptor